MEQVKTNADMSKRQLYRLTISIRVWTCCCRGDSHQLRYTAHNDASLPKGSKPTSRTIQRGFSRDVFKANHHGKVVVHQGLEHGQDFDVVMVGVPRTPSEFVEAVRLVGHPCGHLVRTSADVDRAIKANLEWPEHQLLAHRATVFKGWLKKAAELRADEKYLHDKLPRHSRTILNHKKLLLWKHSRSVWAMVMQRSRMTS